MDNQKKKQIPPGNLKADLHSANFSRVNETFRWRILSFQSPFEADEIWIICKATCFKHKVSVTVSCGFGHI